jgi:hypothetical protein
MRRKTEKYLGGNTPLAEDLNFHLSCDEVCPRVQQTVRGANLGWIMKEPVASQPFT